MQSKAQNAVNPNGLTSILTRQCEKSALKKRIWIILACLIGKVPNGSEVTVYNRLNGWDLIGYGGTVGYVSNRYIMA